MRTIPVSGPPLGTPERGCDCRASAALLGARVLRGRRSEPTIHQAQSLSQPQAGSLQRLKKRQRTLERKRRKKQGVYVPPPHLFPSDSQTRPESVHSGQERGPPVSLAGTWQARGWVLPPECPGHFSERLEAGSRVSMLVGRGATVGSPAMTWGPGGPGKATWVGPVQPHWLHSQKHLLAKAPCPGPGGADGGQAARGCGGPGTSVLSPVTWCRVHGWLLDCVSTHRHRHRGAGFVSQAILYFNFRCIS